MKDRSGTDIRMALILAVALILINRACETTFAPSMAFTSGTCS